jgi:ATP-dependent RNA helicase SUPV3L1/SUV3
MKAMPPSMSASRVVAVLGPTNTGKTHLAVERLLAHASGMIGLPLRLLAREIYDRIVRVRGLHAVALMTGEEKIVPRDPAYWVCTVEAMPLERRVEFIAVDEIQLCGDPERGHVFTNRLLHARGSSETMFMGAATVAPLIRRLVPGVEIQSRERLSKLTYDGSKKLTRLPRRSAIVAFSADQVYAIAELIRRQRGGAAVVMGSLSPRTRNAQVALFQSGEVDFLVATDAIGMGLNMDVDHVAFAGLRKFDGRRLRGLHPQEIGQVAGRAGRFRNDGTFGVTGEAPDIDADIVAAVEGHVFDALEAAEWRNAALDFSSIKALTGSLVTAAPRPGLRLSEEAQDETTLRQLATDELVMRRCRDRGNLMRLWEVCQTPDFRKATQDEHARLVGAIFEHLTQGRRRLPAEWMQDQYGGLDRVDGEIDTISARLARVRTLAYIAQRSEWIEDPEGWQKRARDLEDRLSDTLHERLIQRFVDRRTSVLLKTLNERPGELASEIEANGEVRVEGHFVGTLNGLQFAPEHGATELENRALRSVVDRAVAPEISRRLHGILEDRDVAFALGSEGSIRWRGQDVGEIVGGTPFRPQVRVLGELGPDGARARAAKRLEAYVAKEARERLAPLFRLEAAMGGKRLSGAARGLAYQLLEAYGVLDRAHALEQIRALDRADRTELKTLGVHFGAFTLYLPGMWRAEARAFGEIFARLAAPSWRPSPEDPTLLPSSRPPTPALALRGLREVANFAAPVLALERLAAAARSAEAVGAPFELGPDISTTFGWAQPQLEAMLKAFGFRRIGKGVSEEMSLWRRGFSAGDPAPKDRGRRPSGRRSPPESLACDEPAPA